MCSGTDYWGWMCDECYAKMKAGEEFELCDSCKERAKELDEEEEA